MARCLSTTAMAQCENLRRIHEVISYLHELMSKLHAIVLPLTDHTDPSSKLVRDLFEDIFGSCTIVLSKLQNCSLLQDANSDDSNSRKRSYYRCAQHKEQGCLATKTVQQKNGNNFPPKFEVAYNMNHTCKIVEKSKGTSCIGKKLKNPAYIELDDYPSNDILDIEKLLHEPHKYTPSIEHAIQTIFSPSWDFNIDIWDDIDRLFS